MKDKPKLSVIADGKEKQITCCSPFIKLKNIAQVNELGQLVTHDGQIIHGICVLKQSQVTKKKPFKLA